MTQYQYVGKEYTATPLEKNGEHVKVVEGEIIESELPEEFFTNNGFVKVEGTILAEVSEEVTEETETIAETEEETVSEEVTEETETPKNTSKKSK